MLGYDTFKAELFAMVEQDRAVGIRLDLVQIGHPRLAAEPMQIALALGKRQPAQIDAILVQQIEGQKHQLALVRMARAHL